MLIGTLALTGFPLTAGYYSKDAVIETAFASHDRGRGLLLRALIIGALLTSIYSWRLMFLTFHGKARASEEVMSHVHESPTVMLIPLYVLAAGSLLAGYLFKDYFFGADEALFWSNSIYRRPENEIVHEIHNVPWSVKQLPTGMMALGLAIALLFYIVRPGWPKRVAAISGPLYRFLLNKWYFDELYDALFVRPTKALGRLLWKKGDGLLIDGLGPDGVAARVIDVTRGVVRLQTGYVYHYAFAMLIGVALLVTWYMFAGRP